MVLVAPYTDAIHDPGAWADLVTSMGGEPVNLVWIGIDETTLKARLRSRGSVRDGAKLADFDAFARRMRPGRPPAVPHFAVNNRGPLASLADQVAALVS